MTRRMAGDPDVLRLLAADRDRLYQHGLLSDEDLGTPGRNEDYDPESLIEALEADSADPRYEYVVDPHGYGAYEWRGSNREVDTPSEEEKALAREAENAYMDRLMAGLLKKEEDQLAVTIEAQGYSPQEARLMAAKYISETGGVI